MLFASPTNKGKPSEKTRVKLLTDVKDIGKKGEIVFVSTVMYINALQAKKLAIKISDEEMQSILKIEKEKQEKALQVAQNYAMKLKDLPNFILKRKANAANRQLFGSVNTKHVEDELRRLCPDTTLPWGNRHIGVTDLHEVNEDGSLGSKVNEIRKVGKYIAMVRLHSDLPPHRQPVDVLPE
eukprot:gene6947-7686_t